MVPRADKPPRDEEIAEPKDRTVVDYDSAEQVCEALKSVDLSGNKDWTLNKFDVKTSIADQNNIEDEAERLLCLKSYGILDTENEVEFEAITKEAADFFGCPIAAVSLVDMGRQWFKSIQGLPVESTPRCLAFCSHVVKRKEQDGVLVVADATKDPRFMENPLVTGGPLIRFYAGAPLLSPEGHRLGSFCVIDMEPHPEGLSEAAKDRLETFASEAVLHMISRTE
jgi:GAF domain-containing protein